MSRTVDFLYRFEVAAAEESIPTAGRPVACSLTFGQTSYLDVGSDQLPLVPETRRWLRSHGLAFREVAHPLRLPSKAGLYRILKPDLTVASADIDGVVATSEPCSACGFARDMPVDEPHLSFTGDRSKLPGPTGLGYLASIGATVAHVALLDEFVGAKLSDGLEVFEIEGAPDHRVLAAQQLDSALAPFGYWGERCSTCGRDVDTGQPLAVRYQIYPTYVRLLAGERWWSEPIEGPFRLLATPGIVKALRRHTSEMSLLARGWSPDDDDRSFLDVRFHDDRDLG